MARDMNRSRTSDHDQKFVITVTGTPRQRAMTRAMLEATVVLWVWFIVTAGDSALGIHLALPWLAAVGGMVGFATERALNRAVRWKDGSA